MWNVLKHVTLFSGLKPALHVESVLKYNTLFAGLNPAPRVESVLKHMTLFSGLRHDYFIGLTDEAQTNVWEWVDTITTLNYTNWGPNQPDHRDHEEHCVFMLHDDAYEWHDVPCVDRNRFICESEEINVNIIG